MKKKYSLDYGIERDIDRLHAVEDILDTLPENPTNTELEQMASYILYGKDENGQNAVQRKETTDTNKRYRSFKRMDDKAASLDELLENPLSDQLSLKPANERYVYTKKQTEIHRPKYDKKTGKLIDPGDSDIPGMQELWERIDYLERVLAANEGKIPFDDTMSILKNNYEVYKLRHMLIDLRLHQYYLKDSAKPTLHFIAAQHPQPQTINWDDDAAYWISLDEWERRTTTSLLRISTNLKDYTTRRNPITKQTEVKWVVRQHNFNWENPSHIAELIDHYSNIYMEVYDRLHSWGRTLIWDFDRYAAMCNFSEVREYILLRRIDRATYAQLAAEILEKFGIKYNETHLCTIARKEIPERIAAAAKRYRLMVETPQSEKKQCFRCKQWFPRNTLFFGINNGRRDHFASNCKECERKRRIAKGGQGINDRRNKESKMYEVQTGETNT